MQNVRGRLRAAPDDIFSIRNNNNATGRLALPALPDYGHSSPKPGVTVI